MDKSILKVVHESANDLYEAGVIDAVTMREYDVLCLPRRKRACLFQQILVRQW